MSPTDHVDISRRFDQNGRDREVAGRARAELPTFRR
jgi:hypothetical protein